MSSVLTRAPTPSSPCWWAATSPESPHSANRPRACNRQKGRNDVTVSADRMVGVVDGVALITMNNGRVNALGSALRRALCEALAAAAADPAVTAALLLGQP